MECNCLNFELISIDRNKKENTGILEISQLRNFGYFANCLIPYEGYLNVH